MNKKVSTCCKTLPLRFGSYWFFGARRLGTKDLWFLLKQEIESKVVVKLVLPIKGKSNLQCGTKDVGCKFKPSCRLQWCWPNQKASYDAAEKKAIDCNQIPTQKFKICSKLPSNKASIVQAGYTLEQILIFLELLNCALVSIIRIICMCQKPIYTLV